MVSKVRISLSADSILYFPIYLLAVDPVAYGLNDFVLELNEAGDDKKALHDLDNGYHFAVCDPVYLYLDEDSSKRAIKPLVIKSAIWITSPNDTMESIREVTTITTHPKDTTTSNSVKILQKETTFSLPNTGKFHVTKSSTINHVPIGDELKYIDESSKIENRIIITSDILQLMSKKLDYIGLYALKDHEIFRKNIFTALISHNILLKRNVALVEKMVKAIDSVLLSFMEKDKDTKSFKAIAKKIYDYSENSDHSQISKNYTVDDMARVLKLLYENEFYPKDKTISLLHKYWENSCIIAKGDMSK